MPSLAQVSLTAAVSSSSSGVVLMRAAGRGRADGVEASAGESGDGNTNLSKGRRAGRLPRGEKAAASRYVVGGGAVGGGDVVAAPVCSPGSTPWPAHCCSPARGTGTGTWPRPWRAWRRSAWWSPART